MGTWEDKGERAKKMSRAMIRTGTNSSSRGGGGSGGTRSGSSIRKIAKKINAMTDLMLKNLIIKLYTNHPTCNSNIAIFYPANPAKPSMSHHQAWWSSSSIVALAASKR